MDLTEISVALRSWWVVWLTLLFVGIVAWTCWPSRRRGKEMRDHANIPFRGNDGPV